MIQALAIVALAVVLVALLEVRGRRLERERRWNIPRWDGSPQAHPRTYRATIDRELRREFAWPRPHAVLSLDSAEFKDQIAQIQHDIGRLER